MAEKTSFSSKTDDSQGRLRAWANWARAQGLALDGGHDSFSTLSKLYHYLDNFNGQFTCRNCGGGDRGRVAIYRPFGEVSLSLNRTVTCMVLKANDRRTSCPCHDEFRGPRSDYVRQVALATTTTSKEYIATFKSDFCQ
ncbi:uncharacterized protein TNCV_626391 [Trichonephila clavipes]|nr:uncharacterized protein TNCV_626391 [Trichonephila clavipes]